MNKNIQNVITFQGLKNKKILANFNGGEITSDAGILLLRATDKKLKFTQNISKVFVDKREHVKVKHSIQDMFRQRIFAIALGYEDLNDHEFLKQDKAIQVSVGKESLLASPPTLCRFENNFDRKTAVEIHKKILENFVNSFSSSPKELVLDFDAIDDPVHGNQEKKAYNGYYKCDCFLPLHIFCKDQLLVSYLRPSNQDGAKHAWAILSLLVKYFRKIWPDVKIKFRADSGFCRHKMLNRIVQMVVKLEFESKIEPFFLEDSYGYRPNKSAIDAIRVTRKRCWKYDWVLEFDIKGLFDNIPHNLLMKAVRTHTNCKWIIMYIERWLKASISTLKGENKRRDKGTPQGGVISPLLSNLFLHYAYDLWMKINHPDKPWCRYADDGLAHCKTEDDAKQLLAEMEVRFAECGLELHPDKTKIIYCKDSNRKEKYRNKSFDFWGYTFRCREARNTRNNTKFGSFIPAVSKSALKSMRKKTRRMNWRNRTDLSLKEISTLYNPVLIGWRNYYGKFYKSAMKPVWGHFNKTLVKWAMNKYKCFRNKKTKAAIFIENIAEKQKKLFIHWEEGIKDMIA